MCPNVTRGGDVGTDFIEYSTGEETDRILREELGRANITSTTKRAAKGRINVEKEKSKKSKTNVIASAVMGDMFNPHVNQGRAYIRYVCTELLKHPTFKSDLVVGLACFEYSVLITLPKGQAMDCYARLFQSFCVRGWLAKELKNGPMDDYLEIVDDLRFLY